MRNHVCHHAGQSLRQQRELGGGGGQSGGTDKIRGRIGVDTSLRTFQKKSMCSTSTSNGDGAETLTEISLERVHLVHVLNDLTLTWPS